MFKVIAERVFAPCRIAAGFAQQANIVHFDKRLARMENRMGVAKAFGALPEEHSVRLEKSRPDAWPARHARQEHSSS